MSLDTPVPDHSDSGPEPASDGFSVDVHEHGDARVLTVAGDVDVATAGAFRDKAAEVLEAGACDLVVDLDRVDFLDSTGLGVLVAIHRRATRQGGSMSVVCNNPTCMLVINVAGLNQVMRFHDSVEAAVADAGSAGSTGGR